MENRKVLISLCVGLGMILFAGCSREDRPDDSRQVKSVPIPDMTTPVVIAFYNATPVTGDAFAEQFTNPIVKKFPNVTLDIIEQKQKGNSPEELTAAGVRPDLAFMTARNWPQLLDAGMLADLNEPVKKFGFDLGIFKDGLIHSVLSMSGGKQLIAFPYSLTFGTLQYNKDIFDKFGVPYPRDGMTWEETLQLAQKVTRLDDGVQYRGIDFAFNLFPLPAPLVDPKANKATANTDSWKRWFDTTKAFYEIPGNAIAAKASRNMEAFLKDKTLAMQVGVVSLQQFKNAQDTAPRWDMVTLPTYPDMNGVQFNIPLLGVGAASTHPDEAFKILEYLVSGDYQSDRSGQGVITVLKNRSDIESRLGANMGTFLQGKNIGAFTKTKTESRSVTKYDNIVLDVLNKKLTEVAQGLKDSNTALREAEDEANKSIEAAQK